MTEVHMETDNRGNRSWYNQNNQRHREDGPAVESVDGTKLWYQNNRLHRKDGPAIERADGTKFWYQNDQFHREDGPAIEYANGTKEWWLNDEELTEEEFNRRTDRKSSYIKKEDEILKYVIDRINRLTEDLEHMDLNDQWLVRHETLVKIEELRKIIAFIGGY